MTDDVRGGVAGRSGFRAVVVPVAGLGTRFESITKIVPKE